MMLIIIMFSLINMILIITVIIIIIIIGQAGACGPKHVLCCPRLWPLAEYIFLSLSGSQGLGAVYRGSRGLRAIGEVVPHRREE